MDLEEASDKRAISSGCICMFEGLSQDAKFSFLMRWLKL